MKHVRSGFLTPTPVQKAVIPRLLNGENLVMAASTGSGKTLAFTLPVIQTLISQEQQVRMFYTAKNNLKIFVLFFVIIIFVS